MMKFRPHQFLYKRRSASSEGFEQPPVGADAKSSHFVWLIAASAGWLNLESAPTVDGFEAGFQVATFHPNLVLLDVKMPGMDGLQVCRRIKADPAMRATRVVFLSGYLSAEGHEAMRVAGADLCIEKPLDMALLATQLEFGATQVMAGNSC